MDALKSSLSPARQRLLKEMQTLHFGHIEGLVVRNGDPVFNPSPRIVREIRFGSENSPRQKLKDFAMKTQVVELFDCFTSLDNGVVKTLHIKHGLPFRMNVEETIQP